MGRSFQAGDISAMLVRLELEDHYATLTELGSAATLRSFRLNQIERELASDSSSLFVDGLDELRSLRDSQSEEWMPRERVRATLRSAWTPEDEDSSGRTVLTVLWFQNEGEDPFRRLAGILAALDWPSEAAYDPDDR